MDFRLLQLADSAFPTGGFVHSGGLEAAARLGLVRDLEPWLRDSLSQAGRGMLPLATAGYRDHPDAEVIADAWLSNEVAHRASKAQGAAWVATAAAVFPGPELAALKHRARLGEVGHLAPVFGRVCAILGVTCTEMQRLFLFLHLRGQVSTAVRLGLVGPLEAQRLQGTFTVDLDAVHAGCAELTLDDLATIAPLHDLAHAHHDRLYSRMFAT
jgi:urease accessory protein